MNRSSYRCPRWQRAPRGGAGTGQSVGSIYKRLPRTEFLPSRRERTRMELAGPCI